MGGLSIINSIGIIRRIDVLGQIVVPVEIRKVLNIDYNDGIAFFVDEDKIVLQKYEPFCILCKGADGLLFFKKKYICVKCKTEITRDMI